MDWLYSVILGIVEGLTEFLPVSSTGHLIVAGDLLRVPWQKNVLDTFEVVIQGGAILAVVVYYWRDLVRQASTINKDAGVQRLWLGIVVACIPAVILGALFGSKIKALLFTPTVVAWALIVGGVLMYFIEMRPRPATTHKLESISLPQAITVGVVQCLALLWPGFSRSASSILGGMLTGLDRPTATKFSFYLGIPVLGGATLLDFVKHKDDLGAAGLTNVGIGFVVSFIVAYFVIGWLLRFVSTHDFKGFAVYRIIIGVIILVLIYSGVINNLNRA
ncbi:undecaprenyl-diphosphate phosphatase [Deinococcus psychrotolerans]|uniref:Undecaprenyl-diphosphatase n=1 Tax=Deinococcus psychrotolerans TaxID=2489213 RepID=A0A3G8YED1_9DEIO|nr:undecaprenyl-diphosphate phosphatase [Deinococcus psychrotolerans]AZI43672.1 undecaprenyl-diphosphate phosphatase [Deinococcus psychrotolerans]